MTRGMRRFWGAGLCALLLLATPVAGRPAAPQSPEKRADDLLKQMTLDEKIGQLNQNFYMGAFMKPEMMEQAIKDGKLGSLLFVTDPALVNRFQKVAVEQSRLKIPLLFGFDVIHGFRTIFPIPIGMAASWDPALVEQAQTVAAREASAVGVRWTFAPMVDIARDPRWGRIIEGAGEDPYLGSAIARAQVRGFQGPDMSQPDRLMACAKHFAAYGAADGGRDYDSTYVPDVLLHNVYLPPFKAAADAGVGTFMAAYQDLNDVPASGNKFLLQDVLRKDWKFNGFVVSDAESVGNLVTHGFARDKADAAYRGFTAGVNMEMSFPGAPTGSAYISSLAQHVKDGRITEAQIDAAVRPILEAKFRLGLFDRPYVDESRVASVLGAAAHKQLSRVAAQRSAVLLRNQGNLLPLDKGRLKSVAVIGQMADSQSDTIGSWSLATDGKDAVTVVQGLRNKLGSGATVEYTQGYQINRVYPSFFDAFFPGAKVEPWSDAQSQQEFTKAVDLAKKSDVAVFVLGETQNMSGEAASKATLALPGRQRELLDAVLATGKPVVVVLMNGRPLDLSWAADRIPALLEVWHPGTEGGNAVADLLFGDATPGGKLPVTWPRNEGQIPIYYAHNLTQAPENAPGFTSRYWDVQTSPLYPFGYGLSYTTFAYSNLKVSKAEAKRGEAIEVTVDVENTGKRAGDEVAQLYVHQQSGSASRPVRELKGFQRISLAPGEKKTVRFTLGKAELSYWSPQERSWVNEAAKFDVWAGGDSTAGLHADFEVRE